MKLSNRSKIEDVKIFNLDKHIDHRGYITKVFDEKIRLTLTNDSRALNYMYETYSRRDVLRGLHYQIEKPQSRLLRVSYGAIYDVVLDLRKSSPTFGKWQAEILSSEKSGAIWIPAGVAHGYFVMSEIAILNIQTDYEYFQNLQRVIKWNDTSLAIDWPIYADFPIMIPPILSDRDELGVNFSHADFFD